MDHETQELLDRLVTLETGQVSDVMDVGDADGVVVVPRSAARGIIEDAETLQRIERTIGEELRRGEPRAAVFKRNPRFGHVRRATGA